MSKASDMAKTSVKGGFHVMWGLFVSDSHFRGGLNSSCFGVRRKQLWSLRYSFNSPNLIGLFQDLGVGMAVTRDAVEFNAENTGCSNKGRFSVRTHLQNSTWCRVVAAMSWLVAAILSRYTFSSPPTTLLIQIVSFTILAQALVSTATSAFTGVEKMHLNSVMVVCQSIIKAVLAPALVVLGLGLSGAVLGSTVAYLVTVLVGVFLVWTIYKNLPSSTMNEAKPYEEPKIAP